MVDKKTVLGVIAALFLITMALVIGSIILLTMDKHVPDAFVALVGTGVGALGTLLAKAESGPAQ